MTQPQASFKNRFYQAKYVLIHEATEDKPCLPPSIDALKPIKAPIERNEDTLNTIIGEESYAFDVSLKAHLKRTLEGGWHAYCHHHAQWFVVHFFRLEPLG